MYKKWKMWKGEDFGDGYVDQQQILDLLAALALENVRITFLVQKPGLNLDPVLTCLEDMVGRG